MSLEVVGFAVFTGIKFPSNMNMHMRSKMTGLSKLFVAQETSIWCLSSSDQRMFLESQMSVAQITIMWFLTIMDSCVSCSCCHR